MPDAKSAKADGSLPAGGSDTMVSVVAPLRDDADIVDAFVDETVQVLARHYRHFELVLVDDGSTDGTWERALRLLDRHAGLRLIRLSRRFGQEIAIAAGLDSVIGDFVAVMLPESDPPALVPEMVLAAVRGPQMVFGVRASRRGEPFLMRVGAAFFFRLCSAFMGLSFRANTTHFRVMSRQAVNALGRMKDRIRYLATLSATVGYASEAVLYEPVSRRTRPRRKTYFEALSLAVNIITANSVRPLRAAAMLGLAAALLSLLIGVAQILTILGGGFVGIQLSLSLGLLFGVLAVMAEYLAGMRDEVRNRPLYHVLEERVSQSKIPGLEGKNVVSDSLGGGGR